MKEAETALSPLREVKGSLSRVRNTFKRGQFALKKQDLQNLINRIHREKEVLNTAMASLQLHEQTCTILESINFVVRTRQDALKWLCEESISAKHSNIVQGRSKNSGEWFLKGDVFQEWPYKPKPYLLLCPGRRIPLNVQSNK